MERQTRVITLDVYGTILPSMGVQEKRKGLYPLLNKCRDRGLTLCTCSDAYIKDVLEDFKEAELSLKYFDDFFKMERNGKDFTSKPKNFKPILEHYNLFPQELLVIGDKSERDTKPALDLGCKAILVPEYKFAKENDFDLNEINLY